MDYLGYTRFVGKIYVSTKKIEAVAYWPVPTTQKEVRSFMQLCNFHAKFIYQFSDRTAPLIGSKSHPQKVTMAPASLEAVDILMLRLISALCVILPEVCSDARSVNPTRKRGRGKGKIASDC
jgi:hypothetical protein